MCEPGPGTYADLVAEVDTWYPDRMANKICG